ncbi:MAG: pyruvate kinase, partial [Algisphaera sp.]
VKEGQRLLVNDGAIRMLVANKVEGDDPHLVCSVTVGGKLSNKKGVNLPDTDVSAPALTAWDKKCAAWAVQAGCDFLALSFVRKASDVHQLKTLLANIEPEPVELPIIAKIEKPQAITELDAILDAADGVMVARGDLGVEMDLASVPVMQKTIIRRAHAHGKPVIVATQMLESMIDNPFPTRAEVSDVANAIIDGADAVMCSGETAVGKWPIEVIRIMARTATLTEAYDANQRAGTTRPPANLQETRYRTAALAHGVSTIVNDLDPRCVVMWSELGGGARYLSQNRLRVPVVAVSSNHTALRKMSLHFGVHPVFMKRPDDGAAFVEAVDELLIENGWAAPGDAVVIVKGDPLGIPGVTNQIRIHYVGDVCRLTWHPKDEEA